MGDSEDDQVFVSHLAPKEKKLIEKLTEKLIDSKCLVHCHVNVVESAVLLDTGAQVSIVSKQFVDVLNFPSCQIKELRELLGQNDNLNLSAANGTSISYTRWIDIFLTFGSERQKSTEISVPFLVTEANIDYPIVGYNVIVEVINNDSDAIGSLSDLMKDSFRNSKDEDVKQFVNFTQTQEPSEICSLNSSKKDILIPSGKSVKVSCRANTGELDKRTPVIFEPDEAVPWPDGLSIPEAVLSFKPGKSCTVSVEVTDMSKRDISFQGRTVLGRLEPVRSVTPLKMKLVQE